MLRSPFLLALLIATACATPAANVPPSAADRFFQRLTSLCGKSFSGQLMTADPADAAFRGKPLVVRGGDCGPSEVRIAFDVGDDRSRTWIVTKAGDGLRLKHRHLLENGAEDPVSNYGGDTVGAGTPVRQEFPADAYSKDMFAREGLVQSLPNVWAFEMAPGETLTYELARPGRLFRVTFDLSRPIGG